MKSNTRVILAIYLVLLPLLWANILSIVEASREKENDKLTCHFPAIYNFGDSNSDTGGSSAAFYPVILPSGETFFHRAVGRGCDGRLIIDFIAKHLGLPYLSPYLDSIGTSFRHGANFAIGGATIRPQNESIIVNGVPPFSLDIQVQQFTNFKSRTQWFYKHGKSRLVRRNLPRPEDFSKALYIFDIGQNDIAAGIRSMTNKQFINEIPDIVNQFSKAIQRLYEEGAREFWVHNTGPIGCLAVTLRYIHNPKRGYVDRHGCVNHQNYMAIQFNAHLKRKVNHLREKLHHARFTFVDVYSAKYSLIANSKKEGFKDKAEICCGYHQDNNHVWCGNKAKINGSDFIASSCDDPSIYVSWDGVHYTEAANRWIAHRIAAGSLSHPSKLPISLSCNAS